MQTYYLSLPNQMQSTIFTTELIIEQPKYVWHVMSSPGLEAKFYGLDLILHLTVVGLGLMSCDLVLVHLCLVTSIIRKSMEIMNYLPNFQCCL